MVVFCQKAFGQVINSVSADKTGMYYYAVDSLIQMFEKEKRIEKIILVAEKYIIEDFPDTIRNIKIIKWAKEAKHKGKKLGDDYLLFKINHLNIIRDQISILIGTFAKVEKVTSYFEAGAYRFYFKYVSETETYKLTKIRSGIVR